ncbi:MAG TPA: DUF4386 domain-containing protein [Pyrinomonadaceae bacterium]|nr:DUF4386 domain-containing protein [Pyrinomonadaceae bacterium]
MTRKTSAQLAGFMFLFYIASALPQMILFEQATSGADVAAKLASIAQHATIMRVAGLLSLVTIFDAILLGLGLWAITRDEDRELATLAFCCRVSEGVISAVTTIAIVGLLWLAANPGNDASANTLGSFLLKLPGWGMSVSATCFLVGSTIFSYLFVRARSIPAPLAWLGLLASVILLVAVPLELVAVIRVPFLLWLPMLVFEVSLGFWLLIKGVAEPAADAS